MHVEWKIVTGNPQVMRKLTEFGKCAAHATPVRSLRFRPRWRQSRYLCWNRVIKQWQLMKI